MKYGFMTLVLLLAITGSAQETSDRWYEAVRREDRPILRALAAQGGVNQKDSRGGTPLHYAAAFGSLETLRWLLERGADVNTANAFGATPLMFAVNEPEKAALLVAHGADVNARSKMGRTALLMAAAADGSAQTVKLLLEHGARIEDRDNLKISPLLAAAAGNDTQSIRLLLDRGAPADEADVTGLTPLMYAAMNGNLQVVRWLLARGAHVNAVSLPEMSPRVKNGAIAQGSLTPLLLAAAASGPAVAQTLLDAGAHINAQDVRGMTPLMLAIATDHANAATVRLLVTRGADFKIRDREGLSAGDWARRFNAGSILRELGLQPKLVSDRALTETVALRETPTPRRAATKAIALLQRNGPNFLREGGCISCHAQNGATMAVAAAQASHLPVNEDALAEEVRNARLQYGGLEQPLMQRMDPPVADILTYGLFQLAAGNVPADRGTDALVYNLAAQQRQAGNWHLGGIARPPMADGDFSRTAMAIRALQIYGAPARRADFRNRIERAAQWLAAAHPQTNEDRIMQLLGLKWAGAVGRFAQDGIRRLELAQNSDGGWSQTPGLASDAYATGQVLYTLHELGVPSRTPAYEHGIQFLVRTQQYDGSWHVKSRAPKLQPYFESGFPYGPDQWISSMATSWAAIGITYGITPDAVANIR